jgi:hypothetical protein
LIGKQTVPVNARCARTGVARMNAVALMDTRPAL